MRTSWGDLVAHPPAWLGRRGGVLLILGLIWCFVGLSTITASPEVDPAQAIPHLLIPTPVRFALWGGTGVLAIMGATIDRPRWERWGYMALVVMPVERVISYGWSWFVWCGSELFGSGEIGFARGWIAALTWAAIFLVVHTVAGWPEPPRDVRVTVADAVTEAQRRPAA